MATGFSRDDPKWCWGGARVTPQDDRVAVHLWGEHDLSTADALHQVLLDAVAHGEGDVVVDLSDLQFMDAATLRPLLMGRSLLAEGSRRLTLRAPPRCARIVLEACELGDLIEPSPLDATAGPRAPLGTSTSLLAPGLPGSAAATELGPARAQP